MSKLKNTKKGMAKKALSVSLVAAMLATSNVPVWAAEDLFSDGEVATEAPVEAAAPEVDNTEVSDEASAQAVDFDEAAVSTAADGVVTESEIRIDDLDMPTSVTYGDTITATGKVIYTLNGQDNELSGWTAAWRVAGESENFWAENVTKDNWSQRIQLPTSGENYIQYAGKTLELHFYRDDKYAKFDIVVGTVEIKEKDVTGSNIEFALPHNGVYDGHEYTAEDLTVTKIHVGDATLTGTDVTKYFKITAKSAKNAGDNFIIYATAKDKLDDGSANPYSGTISQSFTIKQRQFNAADFVVSYAENTKYEYTGKVVQPELSKVSVSETKSTTDTDNKLGGADVSSAISSVRAYTNATPDVGKKNIDVFVDPSKLTNFDFKNATTERINGVDVVKLSLDNAYEVTVRDLSKCTVKVGTVPSGSLVSDVKNAGMVTVYDESGNKLNLAAKDYDLIVLETDSKGVYTRTDKIDRVGSDYKAYVVAPNGSTNTRGETDTVAIECKEQVVTATTSKDVSVEYTGQEQKPSASDFGTLELSVFANNGTPNGVTTKHEFQQGAWEIVDYKNNTNAGTATVTVKTKQGDFANREFTIDFTITPLQVEAKNIVVPASVVYDKSNTKASDYNLPLSVKATSRTGKTTEIALTNEDYEVSYSFNTKNLIGHTIKSFVTITNKNYIEANELKVKEAEKETKIVGGLLQDSFIQLEKTSYTYTGGKITPDFKVMNDTLELEEGTDYKIKDIQNATDAGTATLVIEGLGKYTGSTAKTTFTITPANIEDVSIVVTGAKYRGGKQVRPDIDNAAADDNGTLKVTLNKNDVTSQFEVSAYGANNTAGKDAGSVTVKLLRNNSNFTGTTKTSNFDIAAYKLEGTLHVYDQNGAEIKDAALDKVFTYDGTEKEFASVKFVPTGTYASLVTSDDYEIKYVNNIYGDTDSNGSVIVVAKPGSNFAGDPKVTIKDYVNDTEITGVAARVDFAIANLKFDGTNVTVKNGVYAGGLAVKPQVTVQFGGKTLEEGKDYKIVVDNYTDVTTKASYDIDVIGINGYKGSATSSKTGTATIDTIAKWGIDKQNFADCDITVQNGTATVLNGPVKVPSSEYTVNKNEDGTYTVAAKATSKNYIGSKTVTPIGKEESVKPGTPMISRVDVTGNKATVILSGECDGASGYDYVISTDRDCITNKDYYKVNKNKVSTQTTFTYVGQETYYAYCHAWKRDENGKKVFGEWSNAYPFVVSAITPEQPGIQSVKVSGSTVTVTYTKCANATGYDIVLGSAVKKVNDEMRPVEYGTLVKKITKGTTVTATFKNVKKGTYYAGLHAYNRTSEDGKKVFSPWSNTKKVTVK